jgi:hypothetical protein
MTEELQFLLRKGNGKIDLPFSIPTNIKGEPAIVVIEVIAED